MEESWRTYNIFAGKPTGNEPLGRPRHRWDHNIGIDLKKIFVNRWKWIDSDEDNDHWRALVNAASNLPVP